MILYDETIRQSTPDGTPFAKRLTNDGIMPGIKVDTGAKILAGKSTFHNLAKRLNWVYPT